MMNIMEAQRVINKINRETKEGKIIWEVIYQTPSSLLGSERLLDSIYISKVRDRKLRLYRLENKYYYEEDAFTWIEWYRLEFIDFFDKTEWEFPHDASIEDLYSTVRLKTSNVQSFFNDYLTDED